MLSSHCKSCGRELLSFGEKLDGLCGFGEDREKPQGERSRLDCTLRCGNWVGIYRAQVLLIPEYWQTEAWQVAIDAWLEAGAP